MQANRDCQLKAILWRFILGLNNNFSIDVVYDHLNETSSAVLSSDTTCT